MIRTFLGVLLLAAMQPLEAAAFSAETFRSECRAIAEAARPRPVVAGVDGWLFLREELDHIGAGRFWGRDADPSHDDPMTAILDFHRQLHRRGIALIVVPIPPKALVYPDRLIREAPPGLAEALAATYREFYAELGKHGVRVIDLTGPMLANRDERRLYCKTDTHFAGAGLELTADRIVEAIRAFEWVDSVAKADFATERREVPIVGDLAAMQGTEEASERVGLRVVRAEPSSAALVADEKSPVLLLGDSHTLVFSVGGDLHAQGAGLGENAAAGLGFPVDRIGVRGSGATPSRIALFQKVRATPGYLASKKVVVWCFAAREFTGPGGWRKIPVAPR